MVGSMTIIVPGVERVVVALPARLDSDVVRVGHMIVCVYRAVWEWIVERHGEFGGRWGEKKRSSSGSSYRVIDIGEDRLSSMRQGERHTCSPVV